jgi:hypothetical protein
MSIYLHLGLNSGSIFRHFLMSSAIPGESLFFRMTGVLF